MPSPQKAYSRELAKKVGYHATWLPGTSLKLGDYGIVRDYVFERLDNIRTLGIDFAETQDSASNTLEHETSGSVTMNVIVGADINLPRTPLRTKAAYSFQKDNSVVFKANNVLANSIENKVALGRTVLELFKQKKWKKDHRVITELISAKRTTIIIANSKSSKLELIANGDVSGAIDIANANLGFVISSKRDMHTTIIAAQGLTPLFRLSGMRKKMLSGPSFKSMSSTINEFDASDDEVMANLDEYYFGLDCLEGLLAEED